MMSGPADPTRLPRSKPKYRSFCNPPRDKGRRAVARRPSLSAPTGLLLETWRAWRPAVPDECDGRSERPEVPKRGIADRAERAARHGATRRLYLGDQATDLRDAELRCRDAADRRRPVVLCVDEAARGNWLTNDPAVGKEGSRRSRELVCRRSPEISARASRDEERRGLRPSRAWHGAREDNRSESRARIVEPGVASMSHFG